MDPGSLLATRARWLAVVGTCASHPADSGSGWDCSSGFPSAAVVAAFGLLVAADISDQRAGCGSVDPTDPANYSTQTIVNDTAHAVVVDHCSGAYCHPAYLPVRLAPGQRFHDDAACAASGADMTSWRITRSDGTTLGFISVDTPRKHDGLVFHVSRASASRTIPAPAG